MNSNLRNGLLMMGVEQYIDHLDAPAILAALLDEFSVVTDYRTLRDNLPRRLTGLLRCRCALLYLCVDETLHFTAGSFADQPGWSAMLLAVAHINPIELHSELPEAQAWRERRAVAGATDGVERALVSAPLVYRQQAVGVLTVLRGPSNGSGSACWEREELSLVEAVANVVAMLLENTRLLERDQERIHELSLLNGITSQMNCTLRERSHMLGIVIQRAKEISAADLCAVLLPGMTTDENAWLPAGLQHELLYHWQHGSHLVLERAGETLAGDYLSSLEQRIKTFFVVPLFGNREKRRANETRDHVLGVIVGGYHKPWKLRRAELVLLQVLANQASALFENIALEEEKRRLDRLAALGEMSASVAHEVRNPLASIKTSMQLLLDDLEDDGASQADEDAREAVEVVLHEVERLDTIVRDLLLFARPRRLHLIQYNLLTLSERLLHFLQPRFEEARVQVHLTHREIPNVQIDVSQIEQVLLNLFLNALQAMPNGGILSVSCQLAQTSGASELLTPHSWVELSVSDTGEGIAPDDLERIFQPFYTTKAHGIGLGLPISRRLIEDHHGSILVESQPGQGTTIQLRLPLSEQ